MNWYYANAGTQMGPVDQAGFEDLVRRGVIGDDTLVWKDGMANWEPYKAIRQAEAAAKITPEPVAQPAEPSRPAEPSQPQASPAAVETRFCSRCGTPHPADEMERVGTALVCASCKASLAGPEGSREAAGNPIRAFGSDPLAAAGLRPSAGGYQPHQGAGSVQTAPGGAGYSAGTPGAGAVRYGGFWIRAVALLIDSLILNLASLVVIIPIGLALSGLIATLGPNPDPDALTQALPTLVAAGAVAFVLLLAIAVAYEIFFLTSRGATPGKMALGLKVVRADGRPISAALAAGRFFGRYVSGLPLDIGFIIAGFDAEKRALHDHLCGTRVVYRT